MKPYKINNTWVDLDHILAIEDSIYYNTYRGHGFMGNITFMFRNEPMEIMVKSWPKDRSKIQEFAEDVQKEWNNFKNAWMNKDKK